MGKNKGTAIFLEFYHLIGHASHPSVFLKVLLFLLSAGRAGESARSSDRGGTGVSPSIFRHPRGTQWQITEQVAQLNPF